MLSGQALTSHTAMGPVVPTSQWHCEHTGSPSCQMSSPRPGSPSGCLSGYRDYCLPIGEIRTRLEAHCAFSSWPITVCCVKLIESLDTLPIKIGAVASVTVKHVSLEQLQDSTKDWASIKTRNWFLEIKASASSEACCLLPRQFSELWVL